MLISVLFLLCLNSASVLMDSTSFGTEMLTTVPYLLTLEANYNREIDRERSESELESENRFDFIVVGGGTAGCIVASRLSEIFSVLLLEAGGDPPSGVSVPIFDGPVTDALEINYLYKSIPQKYANNRQVDMSMGKMLGGTGSHNTMVHNRGNPKDYDSWAKIVNDPSWRYENLLQYFKKSEKYTGIWPVTDQHGRHGPVAIETNLTPMLPTWKKAAFELGYRFNDPNLQQPGFATVDITRTPGEGRRVSSYTAYIQPHLHRKTLKVVRYGEVQKLLISNKKRVVGVEYFLHGRHFKAYASKEVVLSAGTIGTPLLLFKSGIGPAEMLIEAGISSILNLPAVGTNFQDHHGQILPPLFVHPSVAINPSNLSSVEFEKFLSHDPDSIASMVRVSTQGFFLSSTVAGTHWPDIHLLQRYVCAVDAPSNQICFQVVAGRPQFTLELTGTVRLNTTAYLNGDRDNVKLAIIDPKLLESKRVVKILKESVALYRKIVHSKAFASVGAKESINQHCEALSEVNSDDYWNCYLRNNAVTQHHTVGTCRMGEKGDSLNSVVNSELLVHGFEGLRIVDASIMPHVTNTNTNAPVMVIAEKTAELILRRFTMATPP